MAEKAGEGSGTSSPARRQNEGSGTPSFADFSSFREIMREERETWAAEQRRLMDEVVELRVQLALSGRQSQSAA